MIIIQNVFFILGAITLFMLGLKYLSEGAQALSGNRVTSLVKRATKNRVSGAATGCLVTAIMQSSIATNMIAISFVQSGVCSFFSAATLIMGANIGTTITAQIVSFSQVSSFSMSALGGIIAFLGFLFLGRKSAVNQSIGKLLLGFGMLFIGLELMTAGVERLKNYSWFTGLFLVNNPILLFVNGFLLAAIFQSSSVVTSAMVILASVGLLDFYNAAFLIMGTNIGTCIPVIVASSKMSIPAKKAALFNLTFNLFGSAIFFLPVALWGNEIFSSGIFFGSFSGELARSIANFHTFFNFIVCLVLLPILKPFCAVVEKICDLLYLPRSSPFCKRGANKGHFEVRKSV
ncbi:MAG: Na/Pi cotransporter family protein [Clostridia bacterium]|nr:Na/Pi cotransporter family protein [Clostridia bacterium]